jgi:hypothetical protein
VTTNTGTFPFDYERGPAIYDRLLGYLQAVTPYVDFLAMDVYDSELRDWFPGYVDQIKGWFARPVWIAETGWTSYATPGEDGEREKTNRLRTLLDIFSQSSASNVFIYEFTDIDVWYPSDNAQCHFGVVEWNTANDGTYTLGETFYGVREKIGELLGR